MNEELKKEIVELIKELNYQDSIELGSPKGRIKVYVNFDDEKKANEKISKAIKILISQREAIE